MMRCGTPVQVSELVDIAIGNGASYEEVQGEHFEVVDREDRTDRAFAKAQFMLDHSTEGKTISAFLNLYG